MWKGRGWDGPCPGAWWGQTLVTHSTVPHPGWVCTLGGCPWPSRVRTSHTDPSGPRCQLAPGTAPLHPSGCQHLLSIFFILISQGMKTTTKLLARRASFRQSCGGGRRGESFTVMEAATASGCEGPERAGVPRPTTWCL